jgi:hypothetical protein
MSLTERPLKPQACVVEGDKVGVFIGSGYKQLTIDQARELQRQLEAAIADLTARAA